MCKKHREFYGNKWHGKCLYVKLGRYTYKFHSFTYIYIYTHIFTHIHIYIYVYTAEIFTLGTASLVRQYFQFGFETDLVPKM